jgi:hypothetical protein
MMAPPRGLIPEVAGAGVLVQPRQGTLPAANIPDHESGRPAVQFLPQERLVKVTTEP